MSGSRLDDEAIFNVARKLDSPASREAYLREVCRDDSMLRERVAALLRAHEDSGFLESPAVSTGFIPDAAAALEKPGASIGPYKLLEQIGEGGMGLVFMAEQQQPLRRLVALKIIKPGMDTRQVIARFEAERQALALMDHPNIAKVLDAGDTGNTPPLSKGGPGGVALNGALASEATIDYAPSQAGKPDVHYGRPFFVMELVRGIPVTEYCDQARLSTRDRLQLFITICEAVQHAHQKGIIHRDLKPSNILVTMHDDRAVPKVIDFGVAKATNQRLVEQTLFTNFAQMIGTPTYMSPEQAQMSGLDVDTRSDVYSLGVLLYELLTGTTPFDKKRLHEAGYDEMRRIIRDEEPPCPSVRVTSLDAASQSTIAANRAVDSRKFTQALRGDLDWIVMKTLEKDRTRRYESVGELIADIKRYLADEPVNARPPSATYRLRKFAQRRKRLFAVLSLCACFLVASIVGLTTAYVLISRKQAEVVWQRNIAQEHEEKVVEREHTIRNYLYAADMQLAWSAYVMGDGKQAREKLAGHIPSDNVADNRGFEWYHLWNLSADKLEVYRGHNREVFGVAFSPRGDRLVSTSADRTVVVWNTNDGTPHIRLRDFTDDVNAATFSRDGGLLATADENKMVRVWDMQTGLESARLVGFEQPVGRVFFTADQHALVATEINWVTHKDLKLSVWDLATQQRRKLIDGYFGLAVDAAGKLLAAANVEGKLSLWTLPDLEPQSSWKGHDHQVLCAAFSADGATLSTASRDGEIGLWKLADHSGRKLAADRSHPTRGLAFVNGSQFLVSVGDDAVGRIWNTRSGTIEKVLPGTHGRLWSVGASRDGSQFAIGCADGSVELRDTAKITLPLRRIYESPRPFRSASLDMLRDRLAVIDADERFVSILDVKTGRLLNRHAAPDGDELMSVAFAPDGCSLWVGNSYGTIHQLDPATGRRGKQIGLHSGGITELHVSPGGRFLATKAAGSDLTSKIWDLDADQPILTLTDTPSGIFHRKNVVRDFMNESIVVITRDSQVMLWNLETAKELPPTFPREPEVIGLAISPDGNTLAVGTLESTVRLWDVASGRETETLRGHRQRFIIPAVSPDGRTLATAGQAGELKLWHLPTAQFLHDLRGHTGDIRFLAFTADGSRLISAGNTIRGFTGDGGSEILVWDAPRERPADQQSVVGASAKD